MTWFIINLNLAEQRRTVVRTSLLLPLELQTSLAHHIFPQRLYLIGYPMGPS